MFKNALLASALGLSVYALAMNANAGQRPHGWYAAIEGGANWADDADFTFDNGLGAIVTREVEFDSGWVVFADVGYRFEDNWRLELEAGWRENDIECLHNGAACFPGDQGDVSQFSHMVNLVKDFDVTERTALSLGIGVGGTLIDVDAPFAHDSDWALAAQILVQLTHELTDRLDFVLTYRFMTSDEAEFDLVGLNSLEIDNDNHSITVGLRFDLQADEQYVAPTPVVTTAPPPAAPPAPRQFIVYFGFNKTNLNAQAMGVVKEAATTAMHDGFATILVTGHTDTVGSDRYNMRLSARRAETVKKALVAQGIPAKGIVAQGKGETMLLVQTGDREIEPRNRRAEINLN